MFRKNNYNSDKSCTIQPAYLSSTFITLIHLLTDEDILLTYKERDELYKHIDFIIKFLEDKKNDKND